ncbi:MAG: hypothetical protein N4A62_03040 [Marinisporobacter sp.]|nr:hypothetical protein [Marinisporobacter sp.]
MELYKRLKFNENPFSRFSAEEETDYLSEIYIQPRYFNTLAVDLMNGRSRFVFGDRGSGKSALILELKRELEDKKVFTVIIQNYDDIPLKNNSEHMLLLIIRNLLKQFIIVLAKNPFLIKKLNTYEKEKLALLIRDFYKSISRREYEDSYNRVTKYKTKNFLKNICNCILNKPINIAISCGIEVTSDLICKSFNLPKDINTNFYKNYIPELKLEELSQEEKQRQFLKNYKLLKDTLQELTSIIKKVGFNNTVVFMDRIDEFKALGGKINKIVDFTVEILKDTDLLYFEDLSIVFSIWSDIRRKLNGQGIRYDKFKPIDITWTSQNIINILQKRLNYFAMNKPYSSDNLVEEKKELDALIELSNNSPRDLIRLFSTIYDEQSIENTDVERFQDNTIYNGKIKFCRDYDFYSVFPSKVGTKEDIVSIVNKILKVGKVFFKSTNLVTEFKFSTQSANSYIKIMKDYGLIVDNEQVAGGTKEYIVTDPKIKFLIENNIKSLNINKNVL